ncbi:MAG: divalent-cation tolerance protein CutA [Polyangiales bacterium]
MTISDDLRDARDLCLDLLLPDRDDATGVASLAAAPEALAACGHLGRAHRALDRACASLHDADALTLATLACGALRLGRGDALLALREQPARDVDDALAATLRAGRVAYAGGDPEGVELALRAAEDAGLPRLARDGLLGEALVLTADACAMRLAWTTFGAALAAYALEAGEDAAALAARVRGLARWSAVARDASCRAPAAQLAEALVRALRKAAPTRAVAAPVARDAHEALAALDAGDDAPAAVRVALCNTPPEHAARIAEALVREGLAACVNIVPAVKSYYVWDKELQCDEESTLLVKTTSARMKALTERVLALHPYDLPEVIALPLELHEGNPAYLRWVTDRVAR